MAAEVEATERTSKYLERAVILRQNFDEVSAKGEYDKATEMLWGIFSCYVNALSILRTNKSLPKHSQMIEFAEEFAKAKRDAKLAKAVRLAEQAHANFYHGFIREKDDLTPLFEEVMYAAMIFDAEIRLLLRQFQK